MVGVENVKEVIVAGVRLADAIDAGSQDGFQLGDILNLVPVLTSLPSAIKDINQVPTEIADMDTDEKAELMLAIEDLDFASEKSEKIAEQSLACMLEIGKLITLLRDAKKVD